MKTYKQLLEAVKGKHAVVVFGRMQPPTKGHGKVIEHALSLDGDHHIVVSHSQNAKTDPLTAEEKVGLLQKAYPEHKKAFMASNGENPTIFHKLGQLHDEGYTHVTVVTGSDRQQEFQDKLQKYNGKFNITHDGKEKKGYAFNKLNVVSAGNRDPNSTDTEGISGTKMRQFAMDNDVENFKKHLHINLHGEAEGLMGKIRARLQKPQKIREDYIEGNLFKIGDYVQFKEGTGEIIHLGTNYVTIVTEGNTVKKWITEVTSCAKPRKKKKLGESFEFKGYNTRHLTEDQVDIFKNLLENSDQYAVLNCIKSVDSLMNIDNLEENYLNYKADFDRAVKYLTKFDLPIELISEAEDKLLEYSLISEAKFTAADKMKVAKIIATTAGVGDHSGEPHEVVNRAALQFKTGRHTPEGWKIFGAMLNKAGEAGVQWDKNIFHKSIHRAMGLK